MPSSPNPCRKNRSDTIILARLKDTIVALGSMCVLRSGPLELPKSHLFFGLVVLLHIALLTRLAEGLAPFAQDIVQIKHYFSLSMLIEVGRAALQTALEITLVYLTLRTAKQQARTYATVFALLGTTMLVYSAFFLVLILVLSVPARLLYPSAVEISNAGLVYINVTKMPAPFNWAFILSAISALIWWILVFGRILSLSMVSSRLKGVLFAVAILAVTSLLTNVLFLW